MEKCTSYLLRVHGKVRAFFFSIVKLARRGKNSQSTADKHLHLQKESREYTAAGRENGSVLPKLVSRHSCWDEVA